MAARLDKWLEWLTVWTVSVCVVGLVAALSGHFLAPQILMASFILVGLYTWRYRAAATPLGTPPKAKHLVLLLLVSLFFRLPAYHYVLGGQDEGVYVNVAHHIERTGGIEVTDAAQQHLQGSPFLHEYLSENRFSAGSYLPGVYVRDPRGAKLEFQFYHVFPIWMALSEGIFGAESGVLALTFFACFSVVLFYRLALLITNSTRAALAAGLLLAASPLHAFFSKFPVTEIPTLALSLAGFSFLAGFWANPDPRNTRWLWISAMCFGSLFFTRISGFMYVPFIVAAAAAGAVADPNRERSRAISLWAASVVALYALSVVYGLHWSSHYSKDIYRMSFEPIFHRHWRAWLLVAILLSLAAWIGITICARRPAFREWMRSKPLDFCSGSVTLLLGLGLLGSFIKIYELGWTDHFVNDPTLGGIWHLAHSGRMAIKASSLFALAIYLGPILLVLFFGVALRRQIEPRAEFLRFFAVGFVFYVLTLQWTVPYGPYYARYLLSEALPYAMLFVVVAWSKTISTTRKNVVRALLAASLGYAVFATAMQLGKNENDGLYSALSKLLNSVDSGDVVLIGPLVPGFPTRSELKTPITYTFGHEAINVSDDSIKNSAYLAALDARYDDVYLIAESPEQRSGFVLRSDVRITDWAFEKSHQLPHKLTVRGDRRLYLLQLARPLLAWGVPAKFDVHGGWTNWLASGWGAPEPWGTWSIGPRAELAIDPRQLPANHDGARLRLATKAFVTAKHPRQEIDVMLNGAEVTKVSVSYPEDTAVFDVALSSAMLASAAKIHISFLVPDAISPARVGMSSDDRLLGVGLLSLTALPPEAASSKAEDIATEVPVAKKR